MKPLILAVDTTHEHGSLALSRGAGLIAELPLHAPGGFAHIIYGYLQEMLDRHAVRVQEIDCFCAASGPGSFTGVRVGLACVKGLAEALGKPASAVSTLQAVAWFGTGPLRAVVMEARRGEVYGAVYDSAGALIVPEVVSPLNLWLESLPAGDFEFVWLGRMPELAGTRFEHSTVTAAPQTLGGAVARIAAARYARGEVCDPAALDANYVRRSDAELFWKE